MHEAGLASALAATIREQGLQNRRLRIVVRGGHTDPLDFDAALRAHLTAELGTSGAAVQIVHAEVSRQCAACAARFGSAFQGLAVCPVCGGPALPAHAGEEIALEFDDVNDGRRD